MAATVSVAGPTHVDKSRHSGKALVGAVFGPLLAVAIWFAPLGLEPPPQHALAIVAFMVVYWVAEPIDHGITGLAGCFLFWALDIVRFEVAFSGFADSTPWFLYGAMLIGEAAARSGIARRIGFLVIRLIGTSYSRLLLSAILLALILNFLVPSGTAQIAILGPILAGIVAAFDVGRRSNIGRGLFVTLTCACGLFNKMILAGASSIVTRGMVQRLTGEAIFWTPFFLAFLPATLITIVALWLISLWLYPPEKKEFRGGREYVQEALNRMGPWTAIEIKTLLWLLLAIGLWSTDLIHHIDPAIVALAVGLSLTLPKVGVLTTKDIRQVNLLLIVFTAAALGMGAVLIQTQALGVLTDVMMSWMTPLLGNPAVSAIVLYWTGFIYHFFLASEVSMLSTSLPVIIHYAQTHGFNPQAFAMLWNFAAGGKIFAYQSAVLMMGYSFGYFEGKDLIKVGFALAVVEGVILALLVPLYWPLIGLTLTK